MPPIVLVYHILVLVWVRNARTWHASCILHTQVVDCLVTLVALHKNLFGPPCLYLVFLKIYLCCVASLNLFLLKTVAYVSAMCVLTDG